jgi:hypothetical protein
MSAKLVFTFAGDESGDVSFAFGKGASRLLVIAVLATKDPDALRAVLADLRLRENLKESFEFNFHSLASAKLRRRVFSALKDADFEAWALAVDKTALPDVFKAMHGLDIYLFFVSEVIRQIPIEKRAAGTLILDEFGSARQARQGLRRVLKARGIQPGFSRILVRRSRSEALIQAADLVAGAVLRRDARNKSDAFDYIAQKIRRVIDYGNS